jgi:molybdate transport system substrate-binding protein
MKVARIFSALALSSWLAGLLTTSPAQADELIVSAAASLTNAFKEIGAEFEKAQTGTKVTFNFAASGPLLQQIENGAPVDVFASADQETVDKAADKKLIVPATRKNFASNRLVLVQPKAAVAMKGVTDLRADSVKRIGIGNPANVPVGRYTRDVLQADAMWKPLAAKFILADNVRQVLGYVARGEVDAGFVYATDASTAKDKVSVVTVVATQKPVLYPIAVVAASRHPAQAEAFVAFVSGATAQAILEKFGFGKT